MGEIKVVLVAVGLFVVANPDVLVEARVDNLAAIEESQVNVLPFAIVATNTSPKLLSDQSPGSSVIVPASTASPHPVNSVAFVTVTPVLCIAGDVPFCPLVIPVSSAPATPVYVINSLPTAIVPPVAGKPVVDPNLICVAELLLPFVSAANAPSKVD